MDENATYPARPQHYSFVLGTFALSLSDNYHVGSFKPRLGTAQVGVRNPASMEEGEFSTFPNGLVGI